ncbi:hypothetical protein HK100_006234 [Physocladia obscura]|uniref:Mediator of RNA polymerase II transcription subunit 20 n=1 Tax=Physocladia obscura TaxID=109957 RepID=A0AAD5T9N5_9FUNG|nr:hypothetical protein HK100_006234 [Physocladia obscura]
MAPTALIPPAEPALEIPTGPISKPAQLLLITTNSFAYSLAIPSHKSVKSPVFIKAGTDLDAIIGKLKNAWALRQTIKIDGSVYRIPNSPLRVKIGAITVGTMGKGVVLEVTNLDSSVSEEYAVSRIRLFLRRLFANVPGFAGINLELVVPLTAAYTLNSDIRNDGCSWLGDIPCGEEHAVFALMKIAHALLN